MLVQVLIWYYAIYFTSQVTSQKERLLAELKRCKADENLLQEQLNKTAQRYSDLRQQHDKLKEATNNSEIQVLLTNAQKKVEDVKMSCEKIHSIKLQILSEVNTSSYGYSWWRTEYVHVFSTMQLILNVCSTVQINQHLIITGLYTVYSLKCGLSGVI